jgi:general secretion pathway protein G
MACATRSADRTIARSARGFSLLELTLVLVIIGVLTGIAGFAIMARGNQAKVTATKATMNNIRTAIQSFQLEKNGLPPTILALQGNYLASGVPIRDGWQREFLYSPSGDSPERPFILLSMGKDGVSGTEDDINIWTMDEIPAQ